MTRYATKPRDAIWSTMIMYPLASALPCLCTSSDQRGCQRYRRMSAFFVLTVSLADGILVAAAAKNMTGKAVWNLWDSLDLILRQYDDNRGARFLVAMAAFFIALSYLGVNLATNCLPFGSDLSALFPRCVSIRFLTPSRTVPGSRLDSAIRFSVATAHLPPSPSEDKD